MGLVAKVTKVPAQSGDYTASSSWPFAKDRPWKWTEKCERAFVKSKRQLQDSPLLVHYDLKKSLRLACDASPYGVGAVISHVMENGGEKTIAFGS